MVTPLLGTKGIYTVQEPWELSSSVEYEVSSVSTFATAIRNNIDILNDVYRAEGLTVTEYTRDLESDVNLITLSNPLFPDVVIPSSFITSIPNMDIVPYSRKVLAVDLGAVPSDLGLEALTTEIRNIVTANIGIIDVNIALRIAPTQGSVTSAQHDVIDTARIAAITNTITPQSEIIRLQGLLDTANENIALLEQALLST